MQQRGKHQSARGDLQTAHHENIAAHAPQARRFQFQPDQKQQHGYAKFGNPHFLFGFTDQMQALRPDDHTGQQIAQSRAQPEPAKHQHECERKAEHEKTVVQQRGGIAGVQGLAPNRG